MDFFQRILDANRRWVEETKASDPDAFKRLTHKQEPKALFIGCSDSRVPANVITNTGPGEMFVHRNIANQVFTTDVNLLAVLAYAVEVLEVEHVIVCGHFGCGGVRAAMQPTGKSVVDFWLGDIRDIARAHSAELEKIEDPEKREQRLVELNVVQQVYDLSRTPIVQEVWTRGTKPILHGLVYELSEGLLRPLVTGIDSDVRAQELAMRRGESGLWVLGR